MNEEELEKAIGKLEKGEKATITIGGETITYYNPPDPAPICEKHYFEPAGVGEAKCRNCINGIVFNPDEYQIVDGEKVKL